MVEVKSFDFVEDGRVDFKTIVDNFENLRNTVTDLETDMKFLYDNPPTITRTVLVESAGISTLMEPNDHPSGKIIEAFIMAADNLKMDNTIRILKGDKDVVFPKTLKSSEKSGKAQSFDVKKHVRIHHKDSVNIMSTSNRKVLVVVTFSRGKD